MVSSADVQIVWFKRDLRVEDHAALSAAAKRGPVLPLFVVEPELWAQSDYSARQWAFVAECLTELRQDLAVLGQGLVVRSGDVIEVLQRAKQHFGNIHLWSHEETGNAWTYARDLTVAEWWAANGVMWTELRQNGVLRRLKSRNGWAKKWDSFMAEPQSDTPRGLAPIAGLDLGPIPTADTLGMPADPCPDRQIGGRRRALDELHSFLFVRGAP